MRTARSSLRVPLVTPVVVALRDPVVVFLLLAGFFDGISGNPIHSLLLFAAALALGWDRNARARDENAVAGSRPAHFDGGAVAAERSVPLATQERTSNAVLKAVGVTGVVVYALLVGGFARYSWPATIAVLVVGIGAIGIAWRGSLHPGGPQPAPLDPAGTVAWWSVIVAASLWELTSLFLQPNLSTDSYAHPTLSFLTDGALASHPGRSVALVAWLAFGWFLIER
jgi:hypothetical protein